ncbi:BTAD domain-containing putative transcriptional regulator [Kitasatospora sp. NPDC058201]|uniref:BTAD domain-containing putative transcriptional regulator n=1 Tax=unclassified Kitasatospora TaxID=2633591 RepID=UPI003649895A
MTRVSGEAGRTGTVFGVLGPVVAERAGGGVLALKGPRHRAVLARLIVARRRVVPVTRLVEDLWTEPPPGAVGAVQTFVSALRRVLEPDRPPRSPARLLVTEGRGYALRAGPDEVDAWRFEAAVAGAVHGEGTARGEGAEAALLRLDEALALWRGPAYTEYVEEDWARAERARLAELRLLAVERRAEARLALGRAADAVPDLDAHLVDHPWREDAWRLLALALYRQGRQGEALAVLRRARTTLVEQLGLDPAPRLRALEADILAQSPALDGDRDRDLDPGPGPGPGTGPGPGPGAVDGGPVDATARLWTSAAAAYDRSVAAGARARLESTVGLLRSLAVTGPDGLAAARQHRWAAVEAAEEFGDPELTARVLGAFDVPAIWPRSDDPALAARLVAAAERTLAALPDGGVHDPARCRLLATVAVETRGARSARALRAAHEAETIARRLDDPALLAFALNGVFMQSFAGAGLAGRRDAIGAELVALAARHGLTTYEVLGHLIRMQSRSAFADWPAADGHAAAADRLAERHELPSVGVFTDGYRALRLAAEDHPASAGWAAAGWAPAGWAPAGWAADRRGRAEAAYRAVADRLDAAGMPGMAPGLRALALLSLPAAERARAEARRPDEVESGAEGGSENRAMDGDTDRDPDWARAVGPDRDWGPYRPWVEPLVLAAAGRDTEARAALHALPEPLADPLYEVCCCLEAAAARLLHDRPALRRAHARLLPAVGELAGAASGLLSFGPVAGHLATVARALGHAG